MHATNSELVTYPTDDVISSRAIKVFLTWLWSCKYLMCPRKKI